MVGGSEAAGEKAWHGSSRWKLCLDPQDKAEEANWKGMVFLNPKAYP